MMTTSEHLRQSLMAKAHKLDITKHGFPKHPLYVRGDTKPKRYTGIPVDHTQEGK